MIAGTLGLDARTTTGLKLSSTGDSVYWLQKSLQARTLPVVANFRFDAITYNALRNYQCTRKIP